MNNYEIIKKKTAEYIEKNNLIERGDHIVMGVSGGSDSLCMLSLLHELYGGKTDLLVVCVDHNLREESKEEALYVKSVCDSYGVDCRIISVNVSEYSGSKGIGSEEAGRILRYEAFNRLALDKWPGQTFKVAVAHNLDDNAETVLANLLRGSALKGLCGIEPVKGNVIRPILCLRKQETIEYLDAVRMKYCTDRSNDTDEYTRNRIRHHIVPYAEEQINKGAVKNIVSAASSLSLLSDYVDSMSEINYQKYVMHVEDGVKIDDSIVDELHPYMVMSVVRLAFESVSHALKDVEKKHIEMVVSLFGMDTGKTVDLPYGIRACRDSDGVYFASKKDNTSEETEVLLCTDGKTCFSGIVATARLFSYEKNQNIPKEKYTKWFDYDKISSAVVIRYKREGDSIFVTSDHEQKLKKYFINEKIPERNRSLIPLIAEGSNVIWIVGMRISEKYKVTDMTRTILEINVTRED